MSNRDSKVVNFIGHLSYIGQLKHQNNLLQQVAVQLVKIRIISVLGGMPRQREFLSTRDY